MVAGGRAEEWTFVGKQALRRSQRGAAAGDAAGARAGQQRRGGGRGRGAVAAAAGRLGARPQASEASDPDADGDLSARFNADLRRGRVFTRSRSCEDAPSSSASSVSSASSGGVVFEASPAARGDSGKSAASDDKGRSTSPAARSPGGSAPPAAAADVSSRRCSGPAMLESLSVHRLLDLQENEFIAICSIFEEGVEELPVSDGAPADPSSPAAARACGGDAADQAPPAPPRAPRASTPVRRYRVRLSARGGCSAAGPAAGGGDTAQAQDALPSAELEVVYRRLYPLERPLLLLSKVEGLDKAARHELRALVKGEVERLAGRECVFDACMAIREHLRQHHDPSADLPLHERFQRREAEEAERRRVAEREGREKAERVRAAERARQLKEMERIQEKHRAAKRLGQAFHHGGDLNFLPENSAACLAEQDAQAQAAPPGPKALARPPRAAAAKDGRAGGRYQMDFEELRFLGRGGFGAVTMVRHKVDKYIYAIKRIELSGSSKSRESLLQECSTLPRLAHLHIVRYYQAWIERDSVEAQQAPLGKAVAREGAAPAALRQIRRISSTQNLDGEDDWLSQGPHERWEPQVHPTTTLREFLYIQMEFCDGTTLREAINSGQLQKDVALIWKLFRQVLDALAYIHAKGLIHRDLKPPNIFLSRADGGHAKLGDFGLAAAALPDAAAAGPGEAVGTVFYMAPEVLPAEAPPPAPGARRGAQRRRAARRRAEPRPYDQKVDMFSLGVIFFEMWHPPFTTAMGRARALGELAAGLDASAGGHAADPRALLPREVQAPREVGQILGSLLAREPSARMSASELLDSNSGLLPPGAYDPQVQRILSALKQPGSTESVALVEALFSRSEEVAKDAPFFERVFQAAAQVPEAQAEARDALQQLLRETCRRHGATYELCPLLRPSRACAGDDAEGLRRCGPQLLDKDNTRVELRTNLTEPFARTGAALLAAPPPADAAGPAPVRPAAVVRRRYHTGTVYHSFKGAQFGHPMEVSSAVVQFMWSPASSSAAPAPPPAEPARALAQEAEMLHVIGELLAASGLGGLGGRAELQLADTRLLASLLDCAAHKALREPRAAEGAASGAQAARLARLVEAIDAQTAGHITAGSRARAVSELAAALLAASSADGRGVSDAMAVRALPLSMPRLAELQDAYAAAPAAAPTAGPAAAQPSRPSGEQLWDLLDGLQALARVVDGLLEVTVDVLWQGQDVAYGPGLAFRLFLHSITGQRVLVGEGGRVDRLASQAAELHALKADGPVLAQTPRGVSVELALDKLAAALAAAAQGAAQQASAGSHSSGSWRRGGRAGAGAGAGAAERAPFAGPWWRQLPGGWPLVLVGAAGEEAGAGTAADVAGVTEEALRVARGLWRLGASCEVQPAEVGPVDVKALGKAHRQNFAGEAAAGSALPDFALLIRALGSGGGASGGQAPTGGGEGLGGGLGAGGEGGGGVVQPGWPPPGQRRSGASRTFSPAPSLGAAPPAGLPDPAAADEGFAYHVRAVSDQALDVMERALKDLGPRDFDGRPRVVEFFEKLARRLPSRQLGVPLPRSVLETSAEH